MDPSVSPVHTLACSPNYRNERKEKKRHYLTFIISGLLISIPWGVITNSIDLFELHLKGTPYGEAFLSHFAVVFIATKLLFMLIALKVQLRGTTSPRSQCLLGALGILCVMSIFFILVLVAPYLKPFVFYLIVLAASIAASVSSGVLEAGTYILAGQAENINAVLIGQSSSAMFSASISLIFIAALSKLKAAWFALGNFGIAILISLVVIFLLARSSFGKITGTSDASIEKIRSRTILKKCLIECGSIFLGALFSTIVGVFLISKTWSSSSKGTLRLLFRPISFLLLAFADLASKLAPLTDKLRFLNLPLLPVTLVRLLFLPLFLFGNIRSSSGRTTALPTLLANDWLFFSCVIVFSFFGGYVATIASIQATMKVQDHERGQASFLVGASGLAGALVGAAISATISAFLF